MIMISFRTRHEKDEMVRKAREMEKFAAEFVECLESGEDDYEYSERRYRDDSMRDDRRMRGGRYSY